MNIDTNVLEQGKTEKKVLVTNRESLPDGRYAYTGTRLGMLGETPIGFIDPRRMSNYSVLSAPPTIFQVNGIHINQSLSTVIQEPEDKSDPKRLTPKDLDEARAGIGKDFLLGGVGLSATHLLQKGGATLATPYVAGKLGVSSDPNAVKAIGNILGGSEMTKHANLFGNIVKILILFFSLFGITFKMLGLIFKDNVPVWAWIVSSFINLAITALFGMYLFDIGPFATQL